jgi:thymidylate synthase
MMIVVTDPLKEPRIHKALPVGLGDLEVYVREIVDGIRDNRVGDRGWSYSYHDRLCNWPGVGSWKKIKKLDGLDLELPNVDQISALINKLAVAPHSRRAQAITWTPFIDATHHEPPCLQRIWCRVVKTTDGQHLLQMNTHWRSRDGFKAAFMNMYGMIELQKEIAQRISEISGREIGVGRYLDISDSFHIYGSDFRKGDVDRFKRGIKRSFEDKTFRSDDPLVQREFAKGKDKAGIGNIKR